MLISGGLKVVVKLRFSFSQHHRRLSSLRILFFGTDLFSLSSLRKMYIKRSNENPQRLEVVTSFRATKNPIKAFAESNKIKAHDWMSFLSKDENYKICREFDIGLVVSFGHLIPEKIINSFEKGMLNVHASLLPKYRGASPIIYAIRNGEKETGVSIMKILPRNFDVGAVLAKRKISIDADELMPILHEKLSLIGADLLVEVVKDLGSYPPMEQDSSEASYAPKIDNEFCKVRWNEHSAAEVFNLYRSLYSFKNVLTNFRNEPLKIIEISKCLDDFNSSQPPGHLVFCKKLKKLLVKCADEKFLEIKQLQIGNKKINGSDFNNGFLKKCNESERCFR